MSLKFSLFGIVLLGTIISCSKPHKDFVVKVKLHDLKEADIYDKYLVYDVIFDSEELNIDSLKNQSRQLFLKGVDLYKNKKNPQKAIGFFKSSILIFPEGKTYYELGNALLSLIKSKESLSEALKAFEVAEYLNFQPISKIYYNQACANFQLHGLLPSDPQNESYLNHSIFALGQAFNSGFMDTVYIKNDKRINQIISTAEYKGMLISMVAEKLKNNGNGLFNLYVKSFPERPQPFEISLENVGMDAENNKESISYDFAAFIPEMENTSFGREVSHDYFYVAKVAQTPIYSAIVYSSVSFFGEDMQPVHTNLVTYDNEGKIISKKMIACQCSAEKVKKGRIENNIITIEDFKRIWAKPITEVSFDENTVKKYESLAKAQYRIEDSGHIVDENVPVNYNDSITFAKK